jgi:SNF2 family DNA or RNA helicase
VLAGARAQGILKPILLRRTKDSKLEGKPLLTLPPKTIELETLRFSDEEREVRLLAHWLWNSPPG